MRYSKWFASLAALASQLLTHDHLRRSDLSWVGSTVKTLAGKLCLTNSEKSQTWPQRWVDCTAQFCCKLMQVQQVHLLNRDIPSCRTWLFNIAYSRMSKHWVVILTEQTMPNAQGWLQCCWGRPWGRCTRKGLETTLDSWLLAEDLCICSCTPVLLYAVSHCRELNA